MTFRVIVTSAARRSAARLPETAYEAVTELVRGALSENPHRVGRALSRPFEGSYSARRGEYRLVYTIDDDSMTVTITAVRHRRDAYRS